MRYNTTKALNIIQGFFKMFPYFFFYTVFSHLHHSMATLILNCKVSRLARQTSHMKLSDTTIYYYSHPPRFQQKYKSAEMF